tara:strand:- start:726 stop:4754 length:4029 start_codon:yes stop_codon:yes gene_type:complete
MAMLAAKDFWRQLPPRIRREGFVLQMSYDFVSSWLWGITGLVQVSKLQHDHWNVPMTKLYTDHLMTGVTNTRLDGRRTVRSWNDLRQQVLDHLADREALEELYEAPEVVSGLTLTKYYQRPNNLIFQAWGLRIDPDEAIGDKQSWLFTSVLHQNDAPPGDCVLQALLDQFAPNTHRKYPIAESPQEIREICRLGPGGISLQGMGTIEERFQYRGRSNRSKEAHPIGFAVYDHRLNLRRLPPYQAYTGNHKYYCYIVVYNGHAYAFKDDCLASALMRRGVSYFEAALKVAGAERAEKAGKKEHSDLYKQAYELFRETQHLQPDSEAIERYISAKLGVEVGASITLHDVSAKEKKWIPKADVKAKPQHPQYIPALGLKTRCAKLGISASDALRRKDGVESHHVSWKDVTTMGLTFPRASFSMDNVISMDLETCSVEEHSGVFFIYAVGWYYRGTYHHRIAETAQELQTNAILWEAIQDWTDIADAAEAVEEEGGEGDEGGKKGPTSTFVYAHNGSRFDAVAVLHAILANSQDCPTDQLQSNGKFISFAYKRLLFRDSCLITMSSLAAAANSYGVEASKGYLPHGFLQNVSSFEEVIRRINSRPTWGQLEPYIDWFHDATDSELHTRKAGRTWEQWRDEQPCRKAFDPEAVCDFRSEMETYLASDVQCLHQIVECLGVNMAKQYGADIRTKCTLGSLAQHIWKHTLLKRIPKLMEERQHTMWQRANRGGFCGPLHSFDYTAGEGEQLYKDDKTSLYPASAAPIKFVTKAGEQEPIAKWYRGFPDPTKGWLQYDFGGVVMGQEEYERLSDMHGIVRIQFDQSSLKFPFFLKKMEHGSWGTLAFVQTAEEYYTVPHVRMAWDHGVQIKLFECEYAMETMEPYKAYMDYFGAMKNAADASKAECKALLKQNPDDGEVQSRMQKAEYDRTLAKLMLNGKLGRDNMNIARPQSVITRSGNDIVNLLADGNSYRGVRIEEVQCGDSSVLRAQFHEGDYLDHLKAFDVCPYLSAYMLAYSKMLMSSNFQFMAEIGATPLYSDTDSILSAMTPAQRTLYEDRFVPIKKTFGGMENEGVYKRLVTVGPKKYVCVEADDSYEWHANGIRARQNTKLDILKHFERVLAGEIVETDYFSITASKDFKLTHTTQAKKKLRFICLKAAVEGDRLRWWKSEDEFKAFAASLTPLRDDDDRRTRAPRPAKKEDYEAAGQDLEAVFNEGQTPKTTTMDRQVAHRAKKARTTEVRNRPATERESFVYVLRSTDGVRDSYVGFSPDPKRRLRQHNRELKGGAQETLGRQWEHLAIYKGFRDDRHARSFESLLRGHIVDNCDQWLDIASQVIGSNPAFSDVTRHM